MNVDPSEPDDPSPRANPFPGLRAFEADDGHLFFGREGQSEDILRSLRESRLLAVVGASGSGKSSLVRAGLLPHLFGGFLEKAGSHWRVAIFRPGSEPIGALSWSLIDQSVLDAKPNEPEEVNRRTQLMAAQLRRSGLGLVEAVRLARLAPEENVLIVVDQFEELFRFGQAAGAAPGDDAAAFVKLILEATRQDKQPIYVCLTMRSDFIGDCARFRDLPEAVTAGLYLIPRMTRGQRRAAIEEPVRVGGGSITPRLVTRILNDVGDDPDQLPIMQHALMRAWDHWQAAGDPARPIDLPDYEAIGGTVGALSMHADEAFASLDENGKTIARKMFQRLTEKDADNREARRPTLLSILADVAEVPVAELVKIVEVFRAPGRSFLMPPTPLEPTTAIDISHESLIRGWKRLREWVEQETESARVYKRLADTAALHAAGHAGLWRDPDLAVALAWRDRERPNEAWSRRYHGAWPEAMAFLENSRGARDAALRAARLRQRLTAAAALVFLVVAVGAGYEWWVAEEQRAKADRQTQLAEDQRQRAQQALASTIQIANTLVFDMGQDPRVPSDLLRRLFDRAIQGYDEAIKLNPTASAYNGRGSAYHAKGDLDRAIADYDDAIKLDPKYSVAYYNRGNSYYAKGDFDRAIADYDQAIALNPKYVSVYYNRGNAYRAKGDLDHAIANYDKAIELDPKNVAAYNNRGLSYRDKGDIDRAIVDYDRAIELDPKHANAYNNRGAAYYAKGEIDRAIADYDRAIELDPKYALAYSNRGTAYRTKGDLDRAIADYDRAIKLNPKFAVAYFNRGFAYNNKGDLDRAIADYDRAIALNPKYTVAYLNRGFAYSKKGDFDRAIADYDQAIALDPKYALAYIDRGFAHSNKGDLDRAIADYDQAITFDPQNALAYLDRGLAYSNKGDLDRAIADYDQAIKLDPKYALAYNNRGYAYSKKGAIDRAIADYDEAIKLDPKLILAYYNRGYAYRAKGEVDRAIADYDQAIMLDAKNAAAHNTRGLLYFAKGELDRALADFDHAIMIDAKNAAAYFNRGLAHFFDRSLVKAQDDFKQANELAPKYAYAALWLDIAERRNNLASRLAQTATQLDMKAWPAPVVRLFLGESSPAQTLAAADDNDAKTKEGQVCEANFYMGELALLHGAKDEAGRLFRLAANNCPHGFVEWGAAIAELKALTTTQ